MLMRYLFAAANLLVFFLKKLEGLVQVSIPMHYLFWTLNMCLRTSSIDYFVSICVQLQYVLRNFMFRL